MKFAVEEEGGVLPGKEHIPQVENFPMGSGKLLDETSGEECAGYNFCPYLFIFALIYYFINKFLIN